MTAMPVIVPLPVCIRYEIQRCDPFGQSLHWLREIAIATLQSPPREGDSSEIARTAVIELDARVFVGLERRDAGGNRCDTVVSQGIDDEGRLGRMPAAANQLERVSPDGNCRSTVEPVAVGLSCDDPKHHADKRARQVDDGRPPPGSRSAGNDPLRRVETRHDRCVAIHCPGPPAFSDSRSDDVSASFTDFMSLDYRISKYTDVDLGGIVRRRCRSAPLQCLIDDRQQRLSDQSCSLRPEMDRIGREQILAPPRLPKIDERSWPKQNGPLSRAVLL